MDIENYGLNENNKLHPEDDNYSNELDTANIVYRAVINNRNKQQTFKEQAKALLDANHSTLSQDAKQRIIVLINPDTNKLGGTKKSQP